MVILVSNEFYNAMSSVPIEGRNSQDTENSGPYIGLFYVVHGRLYWKGIPAERADGAYFKSYAKTLSKFWDLDLTRRFPQLKEHNFAQFPRGRVVFDVKNDAFSILTDKCVVENPDLIKQIVSEMGLPEDRVTVVVDKECQCEECRQKANLPTVIDLDDPNSYFKTTPEGRKVFFPDTGTQGYFENQGYIVPNDKEYKKLRRRMRRRYIITVVLAFVVCFAAEAIYASTDDIGIILLVVVFLTLFIILYLVMELNWLHKQARGCMKSDEKQ
jgi:hypothetical protein